MNMDFEWIVPRMFKDVRGKNYINPSCVGGDEILNELKPEIAAHMKTDENPITIYQEDWGWALEFSMDKVDYLLAVNNSSEAETERNAFFRLHRSDAQRKRFVFK